MSAHDFIVTSVVSSNFCIELAPKYRHVFLSCFIKTISNDFKERGFNFWTFLPRLFFISGCWSQSPNLAFYIDGVFSHLVFSTCWYGHKAVEVWNQSLPSLRWAILQDRWASDTQSFGFQAPDNSSLPLLLLVLAIPLGFLQATRAC